MIDSPEAVELTNQEGDRTMADIKARSRNMAKSKQGVKSPKRFERKKWEPAGNEPEVFLGICSTCNYVESCGFRRDTRTPVLECEEFDNHVELPKADEELKHRPASPEAQNKTELRHIKGLCVNCDVRETCMLHPEGESVWHCEEYI